MFGRHLAGAFVCLLLASLLIAAASEPLPAQERQLVATPAAEADDLVQLNRKVETLRQAGKYAEAVPVARRAVAVAERRYGPQSKALALALKQLADLHYALRQYGEAEALYARALAINEKSALDERDLLALFDNLGAVYRERGDNAKAADVARRAAAARAKTVGEQAGERASERSLRRSAPRSLRSVETAKPAPTEWDVVPVFYGTDRGEQANPKRVDYNDERAHRLELGRALVTVPKIHQVPDIERPWAIKIPYFDVTLYEEAEDPNKHFTLQEVRKLSQKEFLKLVRERLAAASRFKGHAIVFVHGYNTTFDNALYRTAQIAYDLKFDGAPFVYSWPSGGGIASYMYDRESAQGCEPYLREFLDLVVKQTGATKISVIAHSMGNVPLMDVLKDMHEAAPSGVLISQVILAAPDVDIDRFIDLSQKIKNLANGVTLYAAANDRALFVSRNFWGNDRAGDVPSRGPLVVNGIDTIDVTAASTDVFALNHSDYARNNVLLGDIGKLIEAGVRPPNLRLDKHKLIASPKGPYWRFAP